MKKSALLFIGFVLFSCKENKNQNTDIKLSQVQIKELKQERKVLVEMQKKMSESLDSISEKIMEIDSRINSEKLIYTLVSPFKVEESDFESFIMVQGNVDTDLNVLLYPETGGKILGILVKEGQKIYKGQTLIKFDIDLINKNIEEIFSRLKLAEETFNKQKKLWDQKIGSEIQYIQAKSNKESLEATLENAKVQRDRLIVKSPFDGIVDQIYVKEGEVVGTQVGVVRVISLDKMYIKADVSEKYVSNIKKGTNVNIEIPNSDIKLKSVVSQVADFINVSNRSFKIRVDLPSIRDNNSIKPNLTASLYVRDFNKTGIVIPSKIINIDIDGNKCVFLIKDKEDYSIVEKKIVEVEKEYKGKSLLKSGVNIGDILVEKGIQNISDGQKVTVYGK